MKKISQMHEIWMHKIGKMSFKKIFKNKIWKVSIKFEKDKMIEQILNRYWIIEVGILMEITFWMNSWYVNHMSSENLEFIC